MTNPYNASNPAPIPGPPKGVPYGPAGSDAMQQFASTRMIGLFDKIRELEERITTLEVQAAQKV
jgi:hypothetical protein